MIHLENFSEELVLYVTYDIRLLFMGASLHTVCLSVENTAFKILPLPPCGGWGGGGGRGIPSLKKNPDWKTHHLEKWDTNHGHTCECQGRRNIAFGRRGCEKLQKKLLWRKIRRKTINLNEGRCQ
jgi:hypothetical protein